MDRIHTADFSIDAVPLNNNPRTKTQGRIFNTPDLNSKEERKRREEKKLGCSQGACIPNTIRIELRIEGE